MDFELTMSQFYAKYKLLLLLGLLLLMGFSTVSMVSFLTSRLALRHNIVERVLPLASDNLFSEIQRDLIRQVVISSHMAGDVFLRDWMVDGEKNSDDVQRYLAFMRKKNPDISIFLVSDRTRRYYTSDGLVSVADEANPRHNWFFRFRAMNILHEATVAVNSVISNVPNIYINQSGDFLGVIGIAMPMTMMDVIIEKYARGGRRGIYFIDDQGTVLLSASRHTVNSNIRFIDDINSVADELLANHGNSLSKMYTLDSAKILLNSRFIPELGWHLLIEEDVSGQMHSIRQVFLFNLAVSVFISMLVIITALVSTHHHQRQLVRMATTDSMTGLLNRQSFDISFQQSMREVRRSSQSLSIMLFDIDWFKKINDTHGHLVGDHVIKEITSLSKDVVRGSDVLCRWGGEEFVILLKNCGLEQAYKIAEQLRFKVMNHDFGFPLGATLVTVSVGVAEWVNSETQDQLFSRVDKAMYVAKKIGRNRVEVSASD